MRRRPLVLPAILICGISILIRGTSLDPLMTAIALVILGGIAVVAYRGRYLTMSILCSCWILSLCAVSATDPRLAYPDSYLRAEMSARIEGRVTRVVRQTPTHVTYIVEGHTDARDLPCIQLRTICTERLRPEGITSGEHRIIYCRLRRPSAPVFPDEVDERSIAHQMGISCIATASMSFLTSEAPIHEMARDWLRSSITGLLDGELPSDVSGIVRALTIGDRSGINHELMTRYQRTGTAHMFSVSGSHVGLIFMLLVLFLSRWRGVLMVIATSVLVLAYTYLTGLESPALRAACMGVAALIAQVFEWDVDGVNILAGTVLILAIADPWGIDTASTLLSITAVWGILVLAPVWSRYASMLIVQHTWMSTRVVQAASICVATSTAVVLPSIVFFDSVAVFSVVSNMIVVPVLSVAFLVVPLLCAASLLGMASPVASVLVLLIKTANTILAYAFVAEQAVQEQGMTLLLGALSCIAWWWPLLARSLLGAALRLFLATGLVVVVQVLPHAEREELWLYQQRHRITLGRTTRDTTSMLIIGEGTEPLDRRLLQWSRHRTEHIEARGIGRWGRRMAARIQHDVVGSNHEDSSRSRHR